jgi:hypothetical protein
MLMRVLAVAVFMAVAVTTFVPDAGAPIGVAPAAAGARIAGDCSFKGKKLYGKIKIVDAFPDLKVQIVDAFPDLKVQVVDAFANKCGQWKMVDASPEVKIQMVTAFPDIKIKYVTAFPGLP